MSDVDALAGHDATIAEPTADPLTQRVRDLIRERDRRLAARLREAGNKRVNEAHEQPNHPLAVQMAASAGIMLAIADILEADD